MFLQWDSINERLRLLHFDETDMKDDISCYNFWKAVLPHKNLITNFAKNMKLHIQKSLKNWRNFEENVSNLELSILAPDELAPSGAISTGTVMTNFGSIYVWTSFQRFIVACLDFTFLKCGIWQYLRVFFNTLGSGQCGWQFVDNIF